MILGPDGRPIAAHREPGLRGGWIQTGALGEPATLDTTGLLGVDRRTERRAARVAYFLNPAFWGALQVIHSYVVGDSFTYADLDDRRAQDTLDDLWAANDLGQLVDRFWTEFSLDGENATVWTGDLRRNQPARLAFLDVDRGVDLTHTTTEGVTRLEADRETWDAGEFVWTANEALYNDPRGWPIARHAVQPAIAYLRLLNHRLRQQDLQGRINAVYTAIINTRTPDGGLAQQQAKASAYGRVPRDGAVVTLAKDAETGQAEDLRFLDSGKGATDAASDVRAIRLLLSLTLGVPEHYLGEGGNVTRTTADSMGDPARRGFLRRHAIVRRWLDNVLRAELVRRHGPNQTYRKRSVQVRDDGRTRVVTTRRVTAAQVEGGWVFPDVSSDDVANLVLKARTAAQLRLASRQTLSGMLGFDPAIELERMSVEGDAPGPQPPEGRQDFDGSDDAGGREES